MSDAPLSKPGPERSRGGRTAPELAALLRGIGQFLALQAREERSRWALWLPCAFAAGIGFYFALPFEPPLAPALAALAASLLALAGFWRRMAVRVCLLACAMAAAGFATARIRAESVAAPVLTREIGPVQIVGTVAEIEPRPRGVRLRLRDLTVDRLADPPPAAVRISVMRPGVGLDVGDRVSVRAVLSPPSAPAAPGAYDFQRAAWFDGLGGVGYAVSPVARLERGSASGWRDAIQSLRQHVTGRLIADGSTEGAVAAALLTGERSGIPADALQSMRDSGLAHLLAISGLHLVLVVALLLGVVRLILALIEPVALRYPIRKWAALAALVGALFYLLLAGSPIPAQRAFVMAAIVLIAILFDRDAISMRSVALAAMVVLAFAPESLLGASFHMSFAAVVALIAGWEWLQPRLNAWRAMRPRAEPSPAGRLGAYLLGVVATTIIAGTASGLFGLYHFNRVALYGVFANMAAVPVTGFWVMPLGIAAILLMPFELEELALEPMRWGLQVVIGVAETVASWPGAAPVLPALPGYALILMATGGLWLCLWQRPWRLLGLVPIAVALMAFAWHRPPDILVADDGGMVAVRDTSGALLMSSPGADRFVRETWMRRAGQDGLLPWPQPGAASPDGALHCDALGCVLLRDGQSVAIAFAMQALAEDCRLPGLLVSMEPAGRACRRRDRLIDFFSLRSEGAHAIWIESDGALRIETVRAHQGERPWSRFPPRRRATPDPGRP